MRSPRAFRAPAPITHPNGSSINHFRRSDLGYSFSKTIGESSAQRRSKRLKSEFTLGERHVQLLSGHTVHGGKSARLPSSPAKRVLYVCASRRPRHRSKGKRQIRQKPFNNPPAMGEARFQAGFQSRHEKRNDGSQHSRRSSPFRRHTPNGLSQVHACMDDS